MSASFGKEQGTMTAPEHRDCNCGQVDRWTARYSDNADRQLWPFGSRATLVSQRVD